MYTEGSWYYSNGYVRARSKDQRKNGMILAAIMSVETYTEQQANGRLMAAAPDMYRLIKEALTVSRVWNIEPSLYEAAKYLLDRINGMEDEE